MRKISIIILSLFFVGCQHASKCGCGSGAKANLESKSNSKVTGHIDFFEEKDGVKVRYMISGLKPNGKFGFHIHENGDCSAADASSAKGHWNPSNHKHGGLKSTERHGGDLGNIQADKDGEANGKVTIPGHKLSEVMGLAMVVHADADDEKSQPAGNAGARIACGKITGSGH